MNQPVKTIIDELCLARRMTEELVRDAKPDLTGRLNLAFATEVAKLIHESGMNIDSECESLSKSGEGKMVSLIKTVDRQNRP